MLSEANFEAVEKLHVEEADGGAASDFGVVAGCIEEYDARGYLVYFPSQGFKIRISKGFTKHVLNWQRVEPLREQGQRVRMAAEKQRSRSLCTRQIFCLRLQKVSRILVHGNTGDRRSVAFRTLCWKQRRDENEIVRGQEHWNQQERLRGQSEIENGCGNALAAPPPEKAGLEEISYQKKIEKLKRPKGPRIRPVHVIAGPNQYRRSYRQLDTFAKLQISNPPLQNG